MADLRSSVAVRPFTAADHAEFLALAADPRVTRYVGDGSPWDAARATARARAADLPGHRWYSIVLDGATWAGIVVLEPVDGTTEELGIWIHPTHWGAGIASRAATAVIEQHLADRPGVQVIAHVAPDNAGSRKLMSRLGFERGPRTPSRYGTPVDEFRLDPNIPITTPGHGSMIGMDQTRHALTVFRGRVGDHNDRAMSGSPIVGAALGARLGLTPAMVGTPAPALNTDWATELAAGRADLDVMRTRYQDVLTAGRVPITAMTRCAVALATLPRIAAHHPDAVVVWFDAHADINTPDNTTTGYLGGLALSGPMGWWNTGLGDGLGSDRVILVGARDVDPLEQDRIDDGSVVLVADGPELPQRLRDAVAGRPAYLHLDCDVLRPGTVPTDYRVPGGLTLDDLHAAASVLAGSTCVGLEIAEFESSPDPEADALAAGALVDALEPLLALH